MDLYHLRQITLLGEDAQQKIYNASVGIVGCGALGSAVAHLLARMGVGKLILIDGDTVERHNLARQHLYTTQDIGQPKVKALAQHLQDIHPKTEIETQQAYVYTQNDLQPLQHCQVVCDGLDTHASRRIVDAFSQYHQKWWVHGAAIMQQGTVIAFDGRKRTYNSIYRADANDTHCADTGVLATTTTIVASIQTQLICDILLEKHIPWQLLRVQGLLVSSYPIK